MTVICQFSISSYCKTWLLYLIVHTGMDRWKAAWKLALHKSLWLCYNVRECWILSTVTIVLLFSFWFSPFSSHSSHSLCCPGEFSLLHCRKRVFRPFVLSLTVHRNQVTHHTQSLSVSVSEIKRPKFTSNFEPFCVFEIMCVCVCALIRAYVL